MYRKLYTSHHSLKFTDIIKLNTVKCMFKANFLKQVIIICH